MGSKDRGFTLIELMIVVAVVGLLAAIAIPNFLRYQVQARQAEAKVNLGAVFVTELSFFGEQSRFSDFQEIGFPMPLGSNRYTYRSHGTDPNGNDTGELAINAVLGGVTAENTTVSAASSSMGFTATATANLDNDQTIDQWHLNDLKIGLQVPDTNDARD